ncbi:hypothetical protein B566_EDAN013865 [Ephemera danica]|nr:hypothetical protein B566_EDAN013865 [Ephemera danica]
MENKEPASWFWQNYNNTMKWQNHHFLSYWKSRCEALEAENSYLYECLESVQHKKQQEKPTSSTSFTASAPIVPISMNQERNRGPKLEPFLSQAEQVDMEEEHQSDAEEDENEIVFEVSEEMLEFFETSAKHRLERETKLRFPQQSIQQRRDEMELIYGPAGPMILSMETAMQLSFDRFNDKHQPKLWPNIPLNL